MSRQQTKNAITKNTRGGQLQQQHPSNIATLNPVNTVPSCNSLYPRDSVTSHADLYTVSSALPATYKNGGFRSPLAVGVHSLLGVKMSG